MYTHPAELLIFAYLQTNRYITERKKARESRARAETYYTHVQAAMSLVSKSLRIHNILHYVCNFQLNSVCSDTHKRIHTLPNF